MIFSFVQVTTTTCAVVVFNLKNHLQFYVNFTIIYYRKLKEGDVMSIEQKVDVKNANNIYDNIKKKHQKSEKGLFVASGALVGMGLIYAAYKYNLVETHNWVEDIPENQLDCAIEAEIAKLTSIKTLNGKPIFAVTTNFRTFDKRVQLLIISTVNDMLDLLPNLKRVLVLKYTGLHPNAKPDHLELGSSEDEKNFPANACAYVYQDHGIYVNKMFGNNFNFSKTLGNIRVKSGFNCPLPPSQIIQGAIRHEFGHFFVFTMGFKEPKFDPAISRYGKTADKENYAEYFANLFSGKPTENAVKFFLPHIQKYEPTLNLEKIHEKLNSRFSKPVE